MVSILEDMGELVEFRKRTIGRNDRCHCGSGIKYKKCCLRKDEELALADRYTPGVEQCDDFNDYISSRAYHAHHYRVTRHRFPLGFFVQVRIEQLRAELACEEAHNNEIDEDDTVEFVLALKSNDDKPVTDGVIKAIKKYEQDEQIRDAMNGLKAGDDREIRIQFSLDHKSKLLRGRDISVRIKIIEAKSYVEVSHGYLAQQHGYNSYQEMLDDLERDLKVALEIEETLLTGSQVVSQIINSGKGDAFNDENALKVAKGIMRQELGADFKEFEKMGEAEFEKHLRSMMESSLLPLIAEAEGVKLSSVGQQDNIRRYELYLDLIDEDADEDQKREVAKEFIGRYRLYKHLIETLNIEYAEAVIPTLG